ncbi:NAD(P)H-dependent oxidoreductase [Weissella minor]|uniref:NADPH-quinone reductase (Modulator of drug activity B) n=1 Tax=Weissella minor TaxID=1620 RepID=A0A0R2JS96_9LACO|nr:NAD(P)H-dependent oxidoreductase [Weissella minor]KRN76989.1 NADPH-quinone reductase (modulator of drug activity B) [Weissella minor]
MKTTIIFDHPYGQAAGFNEEHNRAFTAAILVHLKEKLIARGDTVDIIDLHADQFDPIMHKNDLINWRTQPFVDEQSQNYLERIQASDELIMLFPIWWEVMPAMTKGFLDKVLAKGQVKIDTPSGQRQLLPTQLKVRILTTIGTPNPIYKLKYRNPVGNMLKKGVFNKMGIKDCKVMNFNAEDISETKRLNILKNIDKYV